MVAGREHRADPVGKVDRPESLLWLRCRLARQLPGGRGPRSTPSGPTRCPPENLATVRDELVGESKGRPDQIVQLRRRPSAHSLVGGAEEPTLEAWERHDDLLDARPQDRTRPRPSSGTIPFGDGQRGRIPVGRSRDHRPRLPLRRRPGRQPRRRPDHHPGLQPDRRGERRQPPPGGPWRRRAGPRGPRHTRRRAAAPAAGP